jgi:hypothetical protein
VEKHYVPRQDKSLAELISKHKNTKIKNLPTDMQVLFGFLTLVVDIKYRNEYGAAIANQKEYNKEVENTL